MYTKFQSKREIDSVHFDLNHFQKIGGRYIFSSVRIKNELKSGLQLVRLFTDKDSAWDIYLYRLRNSVISN